MFRAASLAITVLVGLRSVVGNRGVLQVLQG
jgi:hypothetical protein